MTARNLCTLSKSSLPTSSSLQMLSISLQRRCWSQYLIYRRHADDNNAYEDRYWNILLIGANHLKIQFQLNIVVSICILKNLVHPKIYAKSKAGFCRSIRNLYKTSVVGPNLKQPFLSVSNPLSATSALNNHNANFVIFLYNIATKNMLSLFPFFQIAKSLSVVQEKRSKFTFWRVSLSLHKAPQLLSFYKNATHQLKY